MWYSLKVLIRSEVIEWTSLPTLQVLLGRVLIQPFRWKMWPSPESEKVQCHFGSASSWSSVTCPIGSDIYVMSKVVRLGCGMNSVRSVKTIGLEKPWSCDWQLGLKASLEKVPLLGIECLAQCCSTREVVLRSYDTENLQEKKKVLQSGSICGVHLSWSSRVPTFYFVKLFKHLSMQEVGVDISMEPSGLVMRRPRKLIEVYLVQVHIPISRATVSEVRGPRIQWSSCRRKSTSRRRIATWSNMFQAGSTSSNQVQALKTKWCGNTVKVLVHAWGLLESVHELAKFPKNSMHHWDSTQRKNYKNFPADCSPRV